MYWQQSIIATRPATWYVVKPKFGWKHLGRVAQLRHGQGKKPATEPGPSGPGGRGKWQQEGEGELI